MPALANQRHERFAQLLAKGKTRDSAYAEAGFTPSRPHASRLATNGNVMARIAELTAPAIAAAGLTIERTLEHLMRGAYSEPEDAPKWSDKVACLDKAMRHLGMFERDNAQQAESISIKIVAVGSK